MIENETASLFQGKQYKESVNQWCESYPEDATIIFNPQKYAGTSAIKSENITSKSKAQRLFI